LTHGQVRLILSRHTITGIYDGKVTSWIGDQGTALLLLVTARKNQA
jgi:hypothetical protein